MVSIRLLTSKQSSSSSSVKSALKESSRNNDQDQHSSSTMQSSSCSNKNNNHKVVVLVDHNDDDSLTSSSWCSEQEQPQQQQIMSKPLDPPPHEHCCREHNDEEEEEEEDIDSTVATSTTARSCSITSDMMSSSNSFQLAVTAAADADATMAVDYDPFSSSTATSSPPLPERRVRFGALQIHEYPMELGGCGVPRMGGPPVALGAERQAYFEVSVEEYEDLKPTAGPRKGEELFLTKEHRSVVLTAAGYTMREITEATSSSSEIRLRRMAEAKKASSSRHSALRKIQGAFRKIMKVSSAGAGGRPNRNR